MLKLAQTLLLPFAVHALTLLRNEKYFIEHVDPPRGKPAKMIGTARKWSRHLADLLKWSVVRLVSRGQLLYCHKYFAVLKSSLDSARTIFNGKAFSVLCKTPPSTHLPDLAELLKQVSTLFQNRKFSFVCGDIRHWFHQLTLSDQIQRYFGLFVDGSEGEQYYLYRLLPMGWSFSPFIAQAVGMLIILEALRRAGLDISEYQNRSELPPYIVLKPGNEVVVVALWYDNVGGWFSDENRSRAFFKQYKAVCSDFNVKLKNIECYSTAEMNVASRSTNRKDGINRTIIGELIAAVPLPEYLGLEMGWQLILDDRRRQRISFVWRHAHDRLERWKKYLELWPSSCRSIAQMVGIIVWDCHISLRPLAHVKEHIDVLRAALKIKGPLISDWDKFREALIEPLKKLKPILGSIINSDDWQTMISTPAEEVVLCCDASLSRYGYIIYHNRSIVKTHHGRFDENRIHAHIFVKELLAAVLGIEDILKSRSGAPCKIIVGTDNSAVAAVLRRLYSTTDVGSELVQRILTQLEASSSILQIMQLRSEDNPSDPLTRDRPLCPRRNSAFQSLLALFRLGQHLNSCPRKSISMGGLRHTEGNTRYDEDSDDEQNVEDPEMDFLNAFPEDDALVDDTPVIDEPSE
jgi:hypothetical protein